MRTEKPRVTDFRLLLKETAGLLAGVDSPETDASELLRFVFGVSRQDILMQPVRNADEEKLRELRCLVEKRAEGYPLQYILGEWDFYGNTFAVGEGVLIPRPETEQIADRLCRFLAGKKDAVVFDLCAGSGCIGLSAAAHNPDCRVFLFDIAEAALACEKKNRAALALDNVTILDYDIFSGWNRENLPEPDAIVCNPPYVTENEYLALEREIFYEPKEAIVCRGDGLDFYRCLCEKWLPHLKDGGFFMFESGEEQPEKILAILGHTETLDKSRYHAVCEKDLYGVRRFVSGEKR